MRIKGQILVRTEIAVLYIRSKALQNHLEVFSNRPGYPTNDNTVAAPHTKYR